MENVLSGLLDQILGPGTPGSRTNRKYKCPFHKSRLESARKLEIDIHTDESECNRWHCHVCGSKGKTVRSLLRQLNTSQQTIDKLNLILVKGEKKEFEYTKFTGLVPEDTKKIVYGDTRNISLKHARFYLKNRSFDVNDVNKYNIGFCDDGKFDGRIVFPSYDNVGKVNFFTARSWDDHFPKYLMPDNDKDLIFNEMYINFSKPIILVEGVTDALAVRRNAVPLLGKFILTELMKKIIKSPNKKIYIALDGDALKVALKHCETLISYGKKVYLVELPDGEDPCSLGFEKFTKLISKAKSLDLSKIMELKFKL